MYRSFLLASCGALAIAAPAMAQEAPAAEVDEIVVTGSQVTLTAPYAGGQVAHGGRVGLFGALNVMDTPFATTN